MPHKRLFIFVEGVDDERFFDSIIKPEFEKHYDIVIIYKYAQETDKRVKKFINGIKGLPADYIYVSDLNHNSCVTMKKTKILEKLNNLIQEERIAIVIKEIESWYLSGLSDYNVKKLTNRFFKTTDDIIKEQFNQLIPQKFSSRNDFMIEMLKFFSINTAKRKNRSFKYFMEKFVS